MTKPTLAGFQDFITNVMQIGAGVLPPSSPIIATSFDLAVEVVNLSLARLPTVYVQAVYNFAADFLVNFAPDQTGSVYFAELRTKLGINSFVGGVIQSTSDEGTSESMVVPKAAELFTMMNLQQLKTPWGRYYMSLAQSYGYLVGLS